MKLLPFAILFVSVNACAASNGGGHVVGNPMMPESEGKSAASRLGDKKDCVCKDPKATPPCECRVEPKKEEKEVAEKKATEKKPEAAPKKK